MLIINDYKKYLFIIKKDPNLFLDMINKFYMYLGEQEISSCIIYSRYCFFKTYKS